MHMHHHRNLLNCCILLYMGCPAPHITQQMAGGALLQEVNLTQQIFSTLVNAVKKTCNTENSLWGNKC